MADSSFDLRVKPKVLALGPQDVYPPVDGGKEGIFGALAALAANAEVAYAYPANERIQVEGYAKIGVSALPLQYQPVENLLLIVSATLRLKPYKFEKYSSNAAVRALDEAIPKDASFAAIVCHHAHTYGLARSFVRLRGLQVPIIVREHNIEYSLVDSYRDSLSGVKRGAASLFAWLTRREELRIWRQADAVAFLSDQDLRTAQAVGGCSSSFVLAREGVPLPPRQPASHPGTQAPLLILLNPRASQSVLNLRDFVNRFWLPLREKQQLENVDLHVTGVTNEQLARLIELNVTQMKGAGIRGLGFLPSLAPTLASALALVSPTFVGGGIRKKVLEAMAHQLPVIATELDISCCDYFKCHQNILPLVDAEGFADTVRRLCIDEDYWLGLSTRARDTVEEFASWERYGDMMFDVIGNLERLKKK